MSTARSDDSDLRAAKARKEEKGRGRRLGTSSFREGFNFTQKTPLRGALMAPALGSLKGPFFSPDVIGEAQRSPGCAERQPLGKSGTDPRCPRDRLRPTGIATRWLPAATSAASPGMAARRTAHPGDGASRRDSVIAVTESRWHPVAQARRYLPAQRGEWRQ